MGGTSKQNARLQAHRRTRQTPQFHAQAHPRFDSIVAATGLATVLAACSSATVLAPAPSAETVAGRENVAVEQQNGLLVTANGEAWRGLDIRDRVTPVLLTIENQGSQPVRLRFHDMHLVNSAGQQYAALPPFEIGGTARAPVLADSYAPYPQPGFAASGFYVAPYYQRLYPTIAPWPGPWYGDPFDYPVFYEYWVEVQLPTPQMLAWALPEGVLEPGGKVSGFVYFQRVDRDAGRVDLRFDRHHPDGTRQGTVSIPFVAEKG